MRNSLQKTVVVLTSLLMLWEIPSVIGADLPNEPNANLPIAKAAVIVCKDMIDDGLYKSIKRRTNIALNEGVDYLIYEISTYGGLVQSADDISKYLILEVAQKAHTVAYVATEAISAGAMISVSCKDVIMRQNTTIGCSAPIMLGQKLDEAEREKAESFIRSTFKRAAEANGYPTALLEAMVSIHKEIYKVKNLQTDKDEFFEADQLPKDPNQYDIENKKLIVSDQELLTLTASKAFEYGIARSIVDNREGALEFLAKRDGVIFESQPIVLMTNWSEEMVRWLNSPAVMGVLVMLALLGVYIELNTPGLGLPGLVAVICFAIIIGSKYLVGLANWIEVALFIIGLLLLTVEVFILPGFGVAGIFGIVCILLGLFGMLIKNPPDEVPWPQSQVDWQIFADGVLGISMGFIGFLILAWLFAKYMPKLQFLSGLVLLPATAKTGEEFEVSMTAPPQIKELSVKVGDRGQVLSTLRPTGKAKFGHAVVDVVAVGEFIDKDSVVEIIEIHGNRVVVRMLNNS